MEKSTYKAHLALATNALIYGGNYLVAKEILDPGYLTPKTLVFCRVSVAWLLFSLISFPKWKKIDRKDYGRLFLCMCCGVVINQILFLEGLKMTKPINASLIMTTLPMVVISASAVLLKEIITKKKIMGILLGALGVVMIIAYGHRVTITQAGMIGDLLIFLNAFCFGLFLVLIKPLLLRYHAFQLMSIIFGIGTVLLFVATSNEVLRTPWSTLPGSVFVAITYVVLLTTFVAYIMNTYALARLKASVVGIYIYLQPVVATSIALFLGKDDLSGIKIIGAFLIFIGIILVSRED